MLTALRPRGPKEPVTHFDPRTQSLLGMRWGLSSTRPNAVFRSDDGRWLGVGDGEVFNHADVASYLKGKGLATRYDPRTSATCELLLHLYAAEGAAGLRRADAQFALALIDSKTNKLFLVRDFLGVRPIYYWTGREGAVFASEIKAIVQHSAVTATYDPVAASHYLTFLTVPAPRTLFAGISKLPPGTVATIDPQGNVELKRYWDLIDDPIEERRDEKFYVDRVRELHTGAVNRRMVDGPIGALLSGGNDSSANAALMAKKATGPLHTFTVGLQEVEGQPAYTDLEYARKVAVHIGSQHHELLLSVDQFLEAVPTTVDVMDDMVSEPSSVFLHYALRLAKDQGVNVVITGEANDEISCGHGEMIRLRRAYYDRWVKLMRLPKIVRQAISLAAPYLSPKRQDLFARAAADGEYFWSYEIAWWESDKPQLLSPDAWSLVSGDGPGRVVDRDVARLRATEHGKRDFLNTLIYLMMQDYYFGNLMLGKLDLLAGHLGLDARCPYTDHNYSHFVYNIPAEFKAKGDLVKYFFKKAISGILPDSIIYRPKQGFRAPVVELFQKQLGTWAQPHLLEEGLTRAGFLRKGPVQQLLDEHRAGKVDWSNRLWTVMMLNLWHERWTGVGKPKLEPERVVMPAMAGATAAAATG